MYHELTKAEKKVARRCLDKGLDAEYRDGLERVEAVLRDWRKGQFKSNKETYHKLFDAVYTTDKAIAGRYDNLTGSRWLSTIVALLNDEYISDDDIADFSEETRVVIRRWLAAL